MEARSLRLLQQILDQSREAGSLNQSGSKALVARSSVEAALPTSSRAVICADEVVAACCKAGVLEVGLDTRKQLWFWLTPQGVEHCISHFGVM